MNRDVENQIAAALTVAAREAVPDYATDSSMHDWRALATRARSSTSRRARVTREWGVAALAAAVVVATGVGTVRFLSRSTNPSPGRPSNSAPLLATGPCAGLSVVVSSGTESVPLAETPASITISVTASPQVVAVASGPCSQVVVFSINGSGLNQISGSSWRAESPGRTVLEAQIGECVVDGSPMPECQGGLRLLGSVTIDITA
jgi:hypothetical protein